MRGQIKNVIVVGRTQDGGFECLIDNAKKVCTYDYLLSQARTGKFNIQNMRLVAGQLQFA
jgi:hypothetical protein